MFDHSSIIVGLEIGTAKICAAVGEMNSDGSLSIIGLGQAPSRGVRKGEIVDAATAEECVRNAIVEAEHMANAEIRSVYLGVTGGHIRGFNNHGVHPVVSADREITEDDVQDVVKNARAINLPPDNHVVHAIRQHFTVDGRDGVTNPVGMLGARLEIDVHVVHGNFNRLQNAIRTVKALQLEVDDVVFTGLATSLAAFSNVQKEMGSLLIDLGAGTTDYAVVVDGVVKHTGVLAVGGDHVTNDIAVGLKIPQRLAEQLKIEHGCAIVDEAVAGQTLTIPNEYGLQPRVINLEHLRRIMHARLDEIFELIWRDLDQQEMLEHLRAGVFLTGGGARIPQITRLATETFQMPITLGRTSALNGLQSSLDQPEFVTAIGLVKFGSLRQKPVRPPRFRVLRDSITDFFKTRRLNLP